MKFVHLTSLGRIDEADDVFHPPTGWTPKIQNRGLDTYLHIIFSEIPKIKSVRYKHNLNSEEHEAVLNLAKNKDLVIKLVDKGGALVLMDLKDYIEKCMDLLQDRTHYARTGQDLTASVADDLNQILRNFKREKLIKENVADYLTSKSPRTAQFYILPKVHKEGILGRPIISANECLTERISAYIDFHIRPLAKKVPSYIRDSGHFLEII